MRWIPKGIIHSNMVSRETASSSFSNMFTSLTMFSWCLANTFLAESETEITSYFKLISNGTCHKERNYQEEVGNMVDQDHYHTLLDRLRNQECQIRTKDGQREDAMERIWGDENRRWPSSIFACAPQDFQAGYPSQGRCLFDRFNSNTIKILWVWQRHFLQIPLPL